MRKNLAVTVFAEAMTTRFELLPYAELLAR